MTATRGTTNGNARGSSQDRARRRAWLMVTWASDVPGLVRCYRCGVHLFNPDEPPPNGVSWGVLVAAKLTVDRIVPGCRGGTYRRSNIRPACARCNSETGGRLACRERTP